MSSPPVVVDIVGGYHGELIGWSPHCGPGRVNWAGWFDPSGTEWVIVSDDPALNFGQGDFTVSLWVYFNTVEGEQVLIEKWVSRFSEPSVGWTLTKLESNAVRLALNDGTGEDINIDTRDSTAQPNTWMHFAVVRSGSRFTVFVNGAQAASGRAFYSLDSWVELRFGHRGAPGDTNGSEDDRGFFLNGGIDEVMLWVGQALPAGTIRSIYTAGARGVCW